MLSVVSSSGIAETQQMVGTLITCMARLSRLSGPSGTASAMRCSAVPSSSCSASLARCLATRDRDSSYFL